MQASVRGAINADPHYTDACLAKLIQVLFETPKLEVTIPSPIAAVKN